MASIPTINSLQLDRWIKAVSRGDIHALEQIYQTTRAAVYAYAMSILKNPYDADDVMQDCYVSIRLYASQYRSVDKPMAWIMTIVRNQCVSLLRRQRRYISADAELFSESRIPDPEERMLLKDCLKQLSTEEQQIVILHAVAGMTYNETARYMKLKIGTVLSKYHRAIRKLKRYYGEEDES